MVQKNPSTHSFIVFSILTIHILHLKMLYDKGFIHQDSLKISNRMSLKASIVKIGSMELNGHFLGSNWSKCLI